MQLTSHDIHMQTFSFHAILFLTVVYKHGISGNQDERFAIQDSKHETDDCCDNGKQGTSSHQRLRNAPSCSCIQIAQIC